MTITNARRVRYAAHALLQYATGKEGGAELYDKAELVLSDLIADLMHYAAREGIDFRIALDRAKDHHDEEAREETVSGAWGLQCPTCAQDDQIDVAARVWVRLSTDGTDLTAAANGDHEWSDDAHATCHACGFAGTVKHFRTDGD